MSGRIQAAAAAADPDAGFQNLDQELDVQERAIRNAIHEARNLAAPGIVEQREAAETAFNQITSAKFIVSGLRIAAYCNREIDTVVEERDLDGIIRRAVELEDSLNQEKQNLDAIQGDVHSGDLVLPEEQGLNIQFQFAQRAVGNAQKKVAGEKQKAEARLRSVELTRQLYDASRAAARETAAANSLIQEAPDLIIAGAPALVGAKMGEEGSMDVAYRTLQKALENAKNVPPGVTYAVPGALIDIIDIDGARRDATTKLNQLHTAISELRSARDAALENKKKADALHKAVIQAWELKNKPIQAGQTLAHNIATIDGRIAELEAQRVVVEEARNAATNPKINGIEGIINLVPVVLGNINAAIDALNAKKTELKNEAVADFQRSVNNIYTKEGGLGLYWEALETNLERINSLKCELEQAIIDGTSPDEIVGLRNDIKDQETELATLQQKEYVNARVRALNGKWDEFKAMGADGQQIMDQLKAEKSNLDFVPEQLSINEARQRRGATGNYHFGRIDRLQKEIDKHADELKPLKARDPGTLTAEEQTKIEDLPRKIHTCFNMLEESEKAIQAAVVGADFKSIERAWERRIAQLEAEGGRDPYAEGIREWTLTLQTKNTQAKTNLTKAKKANDTLRATHADLIPYAQKSVEPEVKLPPVVSLETRASSRIPLKDRVEKHFANSALEEAKTAVKAFQEKEKKICPLIDELMRARESKDAPAEGKALAALNKVSNQRDRQERLDDVKHKIQALKDKMIALGELAPAELQADANAVIHEWNMDYKRLRVHAINAELRIAAPLFDAGLRELDAAKVDLVTKRGQPGSIELDAAERTVKECTDKVWLQAENVKKLKIERATIKEEVALELERVEAELTVIHRNAAAGAEKDRIQLTQKIADAKAQSQAVIDELNSSNTKDDTALDAALAKWNATRAVHGQTGIATPADRLAREGKTVAERAIIAKYDMYHLLDFNPKLIAKDDKLYQRYQEAMSILRPTLKLDRTKDDVDKRMAEFVAKEFVDGEKISDYWLDRFRENGLTQYEAIKKGYRPKSYAVIADPSARTRFKTYLEKHEVSEIAANRFKANLATGELTVVGVENRNDHSVKFYVAHKNGETKNKPIESLSRYVKGQLELLEDPAKKDTALDDLTKAINDAKTDPRYALSGVAEKVAFNIRAGLLENNITGSKATALLNALAEAGNKDPRIAKEDSSVTVNVDFVDVRRQFLAGLFRTNLNAQTVLTEYTKGGKFTEDAEIKAARFIDGQSLNDLTQDGYKITEDTTQGSISLRMMQKTPEGKEYLASEIIYSKEASGKTRVSISAAPELAPAASVTAAKKLILGDEAKKENKACTFQLNSYDGTLFRGEKRAKREAAHMSALLQAGFVPSFKAYDEKHPETAMWNTYKDLAKNAKDYESSSFGRNPSEAKSKAMSNARDLYLSTLFNGKNEALKDTFISAMFTLSGARQGGEQKIRCKDNVEYTASEFRSLPADKAKEILKEQSLKSEDTLKDDIKSIQASSSRKNAPGGG